MSDVERRFHETWLGMVQPVDGLVVSVPVLVDAQCMERQPPHAHQRLLDLCPASRIGDAGPEGRCIADLGAFLAEVLGFKPAGFDRDDGLPDELSLFVPEGKQVLRPTLALRKLDASATSDGPEMTPASKAGSRYEMLVWDLGAISGGVGIDLDRNETVTGPWDYPPAAKFDRLLRHCRVPVGVLTNRDHVRLVYAPHGESSGSITFRVDDMASVGGRTILDAFVMLLSANRFFGVSAERTLSAILAESRKRQANVTNDLADQVFDALQILLRGFEAAAERDGDGLLRDALMREGDHLYKGLLTVLLRLVFVLYAEDRGLLPVDQATYARGLSVLTLFEELQSDQGAYPDSMARRFGAWGRLVTLFRAVFLGVSHGDLQMPPRRGSLFDPHTYPFLEGWGPAGSAPITQPEDRAAARLPSVDDETVFRVLEKLLIFEGQRLSYRALDVEQIGSVYEALMGYHVVRTEAAAVCMRPDRLWVTAEEVLTVPAPRRAKWIKETIGLASAQAQKLADELGGGADTAAALDSLAKFAAGGKAERELAKARAGQLVLQPGSERIRTSSHYTPRSLSAPIVRCTIEPLLTVMGETPASERILRLKVCDPAMGSGAFLVEACRFLADHVLAAWTREGTIEAVAAEHGEPLLHARRLVAQRCLYGVDRNEAAVELAKLSLWLVTLSKTLPFTFLDHALRHGDSLVGLDFDQLRTFHWKQAAAGAPKSTRAKGALEGQLSLFGREIDVALAEAITLRQRIGDLGDAPLDDREKERLLWDAQDALDRVRLIGDVLVGAFFAHDKDKDREKERGRREDLVRAWLGAGGASDELREMQREIRTQLPVFHWMVEFPEIFYAERRDPLDADQVNRAAYMDAFVGNPPFMGGRDISVNLGETYNGWLSVSQGTSKNADLVALFFRRAADLIGTHGTIGLIATNTIAEGETRACGLQHLLAHGFTIIDATTALPWPGTASVTVSIVHMAAGSPAHVTLPRLDGSVVPAINSSLEGKAERSDPTALMSNAGISFLGVKPWGTGFLITPQERQALVERDPRNSERTSLYVGGEDINSSPVQTSERFAIHFGALSLEEAERWPDLLKIVRERVKPERDRLGDSTDSRRMKIYWWQYYGRDRPELVAALRSISRCIAISRVTKHLSFSFQPTDRLFSEQAYIFALDTTSAFAALQSRIHEVWARRFGSSMRNDLRYAAAQCLETFPFPSPGPRARLPNLEAIGQRLYDARASFMVNENVGLTITYNRLKDSACTDPRVLELRALHEEMDRVVLAAYAENDPSGGWSAIEVPPFCPLDELGKERLGAFEDAVVDRLFALNAKRAAEEKRKGLGAKSAARAKNVDSSVRPTTSVEEKPRATKPRELPLQAALPLGAAAAQAPTWGPDIIAAVATATSLPISAGRWGISQTGGHLGLSALAAALRAFGRPATRDEVESAVLFTLLPRLLLSRFDKKSATAWRKAIGADNLGTKSIVALSIPWAETLKHAVTKRLLVETPDGMWGAGPDVGDAPSRELDARALVSTAWLAHAAQAPEAELVAELERLRAA